MRANKRLESFCSILFLGVKSLFYSAYAGHAGNNLIISRRRALLYIHMGTVHHQSASALGKVNFQPLIVFARRDVLLDVVGLIQKRNPFECFISKFDRSPQNVGRLLFSRLCRNGMGENGTSSSFLMGVPCYM